MARKKKKRRHPNPKVLAIWLVLMVLFIGELLFYTWCRVQYTNVGYELSRSSSEHQRLLAIQKKLQIELSRLKSPERLAAVAGRNNGLKMPTSQQVITIE